MSTINERIARVKRWHYHGEGYASPVKSTGPLRDWSGSIADAWELVEEMRPEVGNIEINVDCDACMVTILTATEEPHLLEGINVCANDAPEAICLAWLAVMEER